MNVTPNKIIDELEKLGLKQVWINDEIVKYSYCDCSAIFIIIYKQIYYCTVYNNLQINCLGEYYTTESKNYNLLSNPICIDEILSEMKILIAQYKDLKVKIKKYQIEQDFV